MKIQPKIVGLYASIYGTQCGRLRMTTAA